MDNVGKPWFVYILKCKDGSLYTGISDDWKRRLAAHRSGKGAKYTKGRGPLTLHFLEECATKSEALRRELAIKALPVEKKRQMICPEAMDEDSF